MCPGTDLPREARAAVWQLRALEQFWWEQPWEPATGSLQSQSGFGDFSFKSHYELEGVLRIKLSVGPEKQAAIGFTRPLHPAGSQLNQQHCIRPLLLLVHCDGAVTERVVFTYEMTWQNKTPGYSFAIESWRLWNRQPQGRRRKATKTLQDHLHSTARHFSSVSSFI